MVITPHIFSQVKRKSFSPDSTLSGESPFEVSPEPFQAVDMVLIAIAAGIPTVGIMGGGQAFRFYPYGDLEKHRVVYKRMDCYDCNWHCIYQEPLCIIEILPVAR